MVRANTTLQKKSPAMDMVKLILNALLWHAAWLTRNFCHKIKNIYIIVNFFSLIKPLEHFKIFTFYIIEKKIFDIKNWRNDPVQNGPEVGEASALLPYHNFF